jgi:large subunit ribosomal protein L25
MAIPSLAAELRDKAGTRASRALRAAGYIPASLYWNGKPARSLKLDYNIWTKALAEELHLAKVQIAGGESQMVTVREIQRDPLTQRIIHVDLLGVRMDQPIEFHVKVEFIGSPIGVKEGGVLSKAVDHIEVECLPSIVPDHVQADISDIKIGESLHADKLQMPDGVRMVTDPHVALASVVAIRLVEEVKPEVVPVEGEAEEGAEKEEEAGEDEGQKSKPRSVT